MKKNGLITLISILAAAAGAVAAIIAITKKFGKKNEPGSDDLMEGPDGRIEIDIDDEGNYALSEEEYQSQSAEIPQQDIEGAAAEEDCECDVGGSAEDGEDKPQE